MAYTKYSLTPANNTATPPDGAPEGMLPSAVNDTMRDMMAQIRDCGDGIRDGTYTMTAPKITGGTITGAAFTGNTFTSPVISGGSINNTPIGATTANTGAFTTLSATGVTTVQAGTVSLPAITTSGDTNTGIFFPAEDTIAFTEGGVESMRIDSSGRVGIGTTSPTQQLDVTATSSATSIIVAQNTTATSGGAQLRAGNPQNLFIIGTDSNAGGLTGTANSSFLYTSSTSPIVFMPNATERMRITSSGDVGIGTASPAARFQVKGSNTADSTACFSFINSANTLLFGALNSGQVYTGGAGGSPYNNTTGSGANLFVGSDGLLQRSTSSLKYKKDIQNATHGLTDVLKLRPVTYKGINDGDKVFGGLIAEEVHEAGLTEFVQYAKDGSPDALAYGHMVSLLAKAIQEQQQIINDLKARIETLESK